MNDAQLDAGIRIESAMKVIYLAISQAANKWTMPIQNWRMASNRFMIQFKEPIQKYDH